MSIVTSLPIRVHFTYSGSSLRLMGMTRCRRIFWIGWENSSGGREEMVGRRRKEWLWARTGQN
jgi:hypothetical protein